MDRGKFIQRQVLFWSLAALSAILLLWIFSAILLPFVFGMVIAYFLDPVADWLERHGFSRLMASITILVLFLLGFVMALLILVPVISDQTQAFLLRLPDYIDRLQDLADRARAGRLAFLFPDDGQALDRELADFVASGSAMISTLVASLWTSGVAVVNFIALFVVTPVVAFYLLLDWNQMIDQIDSWVPRAHVVTVRRLAREIDRAIAGFVRGQGSVCLILGTYYAVGLSLVGLNFGLLIGLFAGLISFIPYVGSLVGLILSIGIAFVQFWPDWLRVVAVAFVFFSGQFFEGNILQPKLVGASVGLHPVWLMFALFAFGTLFGFVGLLIAVPASAAIGVLVRFALHKYLQSEMYFADRARPIERGGSALLDERLETTFDPKSK